MTNNKSNHEAELKAAKRAEIERIWFAQATNKVTGGLQSSKY